MNIVHSFIICWFCFFNSSFLFFILLFRATPAAYAVLELGVKSELQLPAYATATAAPDP